MVPVDHVRIVQVTTANISLEAVPALGLATHSYIPGGQIRVDLEEPSTDFQDF